MTEDQADTVHTQKTLLNTTPSLLRFWIGSITSIYFIVFAPVVILFGAIFAYVEMSFADIAEISINLIIFLLVALGIRAFLVRSFFASRRRAAVRTNGEAKLTESARIREMRQSLRIDYWGNYID